MEQVFTTTDKLSEVIRNMQKCLQCMICLHTITDPVKTICGHRFCRVCIQTVLKTENAFCPLCNNALQRRSIFTDEQMVLYIDRFQKLINGIQLDTGIDILSISAKARVMRENCLSDGNEYQKFDDEDVIKPSCSYAKRNVRRKQLGPQSNRNSRPQRKPRGQRGRKAAEPREVSNSITKYLSTCGLSGIEPLGSVEFNENSNDKSTNKVHDWLETLPGNEMLDDPTKVANEEPAEVDLDDTLPISVSQNAANTEMQDVDKTDQVMVESVVPSNNRESVANKLLENSSRNDNNSSDKKDRRESSDTMIAQNYSSKMDYETENAKPGPSAATKSNDDGKEKSEEKFNDVHRTSPSDMLSTMQQNWSVVAKFGKEMRTKRKKLKTLNVSIENTRKLRPLDEPVKLDEGEVEWKVTDDTRKERRRSSTESKVAEYVATADVHEGFMGGRERIGKIEGPRGRKASSSKEEDRSVSEKNQWHDESFIGQRDYVQEHYFQDQINDIIGVTSDDRRASVKEGVANDREEMTIGKERHVEPSDVDLRDRLKMPVQMTPTKLNGRGDWESLNEESSNKKGDDPTSPTNGIDESYSALRTSSAIRGRLSLKRPTTDVKSNDAVNSNVVSRQHVKRDLSRQIDQDEANDDVGEKNVERVSKMMKHMPSAADKQDSKRASNSIVALEVTSSRMEKGKRNMTLVTFKKLGKTYKQRKKHVSFLYLGTTRRTTMSDSSLLGPNLPKPCNPVDILDSQVSENDRMSDSGFGNRARITVNSTPLSSYQEIGNVPTKGIKLIAEVDDVSETKDSINVMPEDRFDVQIQQNSVKETVLDENPIVHVTSNSQSPYVLFLSENENVEPMPPCVRGVNASNNASKGDVKMLTPTKDSQLRFLSLESPPMDTIETQKVTYESELATDGTCKRKSFVQPDLEVSQDFPDCTPSKKRRRSNTGGTLSHKINMDVGNEDGASNHSFSSQLTRISKDAILKKNSVSETCQLSNPSTKDIGAISLSSDTGVGDNEERDRRKVYKRIVPLATSDTDSNDVCVNNLPNDHPAVSPTTKRKRYISFDSESESDLDDILGNWYADARLEEQRKKKGKLERACDPPNSMNASRAGTGDALSKACSSGRGESTNKLSIQQRRNPLADKSGLENPSFTRARWGKNIDEIGAQVLDEDSPDFGATIDKMKDIRNRMIVSDERQGITRVESLMQDNCDDIFANVNTDVLINEYTVGKAEKCAAKSGECSKLNDYERNIKKGRLDVDNVYSSSEELRDVRSNSSNKENKSNADGYCVSDEDDNTLVPTSVHVSTKSAKSDIFQDKIEPAKTSKEPMRAQMNNSLVNNPTIFEYKLSSSVHDSYVKDTYDMDSLMNITQRDMMLKQFEADLFGEAKSNSPSGKQQTTPQSSRRNKECSKENEQDVEHLGEEDDIVENTPDTKTKNMQAINSPPGTSIASSTSKITVRLFPGKSTPSTTGKSSVSFGMPSCKKNIRPLYQSTPKSQKSAVSTISYANQKFLPVANGSSSKQARRNVVQGTIDQGVENVGRQRLCFVCSNLLQSQVTEVKRLAVMFNARYVTQFDRDVTHVIVMAVKGRNGANKTLKYLLGIAHRKWIVTHEWVVNSLRACRLVNEEPYEAVDSRTLEAGPRKSRLSEKRLFEGFMFLCIGPYSDVSVEQYRDLIRSAGAIVVDSLDALAVEKNMLKIIVIQTDIYGYEIIEWFKRARAVTIIHDWVVECISQYQLISFFPYMQELTRDDVLSLGYPEFLVEEELDVDSQSTCDFTT